MTTARAVGIMRPGGPEVVTVIEREIRDARAGRGQARGESCPGAPDPTSGPASEASRECLPPGLSGGTAPGSSSPIGHGVDGLAVGDEVMAIVVPWRPEGGAQTELLVAPAGSVVPIPDGATLEQASTLPMNAADRAQRSRAARADRGPDARRDRRRRTAGVVRDRDRKASRAPRPRRCETRGRGARARLRRRRRAPAWRRDGRGHARGCSRRRGRRVRHGAAHAQRVPRHSRGRVDRPRPGLGRRRRGGRHPCPPRLRLDGRRPHRLARGGACARAPAACLRSASPRPIRPSGPPTRSGAWRPAASVAAP